MKWISEETLKDCQIFRYSKMENGKEGVIPVQFALLMNGMLTIGGRKWVSSDDI